jgi:thymidylate synthase ThyX
MNNIFANIVEDSISQYGDRLTTLHLHYPRYIHSELMTHRVFSRSAASNRAIPTIKLIKDIDKDLALPSKYLKNISGMQGGVELDDESRIYCELSIRKMWNAVRDETLKLNKLDLHKQNKNRYLEPFQHIDVLVTATEWENFFNLRISDKAQPEINELAVKIKEAMDHSTPNEIINGWHLPYSTNNKKVATARCARISYLNHDNTETTLEQDEKLHDDLLKYKHMSPFEHVARPLTPYEYGILDEADSLISKYCIDRIANNVFFIGNFKGWVSYRRELGF